MNIPEPPAFEQVPFEAYENIPGIMWEPDVETKGNTTRKPLEGVTQSLVLQATFPEPEPLLPEMETATPYPLDALGDCLGAAAMAIVEAVQVPEVMAAQTILAAAALAAQAHANVKRDGQLIPLSLYLLTVAESGDRKSSADRCALSAHQQHQKDLIHEYKGTSKKHRNHRDAHQKARTAMLDKAKGNPEAVAAELDKLTVPEAPPLPYILCEEPTIEGLEKSLLRGQHSQGLFSDEGGQFFGGYASKPENILKSAAWLAKRWDGSPLNRTRAADGETDMRSGCRLSVHLMIQPVVALTVLNDPILRGQGILARFLIAWPESLAGSRFYRAIDLTQDSRLGRFWERMTALLNREAPKDEHGELDPPSLSLTPAAMAVWIAEHDTIEGQLGSCGDLQVIKATAAKSAENILRIAGVLAVVEDKANIGPDLIERAALLMRWYLGEALRLTEQVEPQLLQAQELLNHILEKEWPPFDVRTAQQNGTGTCRKSAKECRKLLAILCDHHYLLTTDGKIFTINPLAKSSKPATSATSATKPVRQGLNGCNNVATSCYRATGDSVLLQPVATVLQATGGSKSTLVANVADVAAHSKFLDGLADAGNVRIDSAPAENPQNGTFALSREVSFSDDAEDL